MSFNLNDGDTTTKKKFMLIVLLHSANARILCPKCVFSRFCSIHYTTFCMRLHGLSIVVVDFIFVCSSIHTGVVGTNTPVNSASFCITLHFHSRLLFFFFLLWFSTVSFFCRRCCVLVVDLSFFAKRIGEENFEARETRVFSHLAYAYVLFDCFVGFCQINNDVYMYRFWFQRLLSFLLINNVCFALRRRRSIIQARSFMNEQMKMNISFGREFDESSNSILDIGRNLT